MAGLDNKKDIIFWTPYFEKFLHEKLRVAKHKNPGVLNPDFD